MPDVTVEAKTPGDASGIVAWTETIKDPRDPLEAVRVVMSADITKRFDTQSDPWGAAWEPRSITTIEIRIAQGKSLAPVRFGAGARVTEGGQSIRVGFSRSPIPRYFHLGNPANRVFGGAPGPVPAHAILPLTSSGVELPDALRNQIMTAFREGVREAIQRRRGQR